MKLIILVQFIFQKNVNHNNEPKLKITEKIF